MTRESLRDDVFQNRTCPAASPVLHRQAHMWAHACCFLLACLACCLPINATAQSTITRTPLLADAEPGIGAKYRQDMGKVWDAAFHSEVDTAWDALRPVLDYCAEQQRPNRGIVSVADAHEYDFYMSAKGDGRPTEWIDIACPSAYHAAAFLHVERKQWELALDALDKAMAIAPYFADAHAERGFVFNQLGQRDAALKSYQAALDLAEQHPRSAYVRPMALRGIGWALIENGDLQGARVAYERSLELEPGNELAEKELIYISQLEQAKPLESAQRDENANPENASDNQPAAPR